MRAGQLNARLTFQSREQVDNGRGTTRGVFVDQFTVWADMRLRPGSEVFAAERLEGRVPYSVKVRRSAQTDQITTGWQARDAMGNSYNVQAPAHDPQDRGAIHMMLVMNMVAQ